MRKLEQSEITNLTKMLIELLSYKYLKSFLNQITFILKIFLKNKI